MFILFIIIFIYSLSLSQLYIFKKKLKSSLSFKLSPLTCLSSQTNTHTQWHDHIRWWRWRHLRPVYMRFRFSFILSFGMILSWFWSDFSLILGQFCIWIIKCYNLKWVVNCDGGGWMGGDFGSISPPQLLLLLSSLQYGFDDLYRFVYRFDEFGIKI